VTGTLLGSFPAGSHDTHGMAWVEDRLWILDNIDNVIFQVDEALQRRSELQLPVHDYDALAFDGERLWVVRGGDFLTLDDPLLSAARFVSNSPAWFRLRHLDPLDAAWLFVSLVGVGPATPFPGLPGALLGLLSPIPIGPLQADGLGGAGLVLDLPSLPPSLTVWVQAVVARGGSQFVTSNAVESLTW
jgi:hypothetical protein